MRYCTMLIILGFPELCFSFWPISYRVDFRDEKIFVLTAGEDLGEDDNEESENEMIQAEEIADFPPLVDDEDRYKPLHSHVEHYNRRAAEAAKRFEQFRTAPHLENSFQEINEFDEEKPFVAGFRHEFDKHNFGQLIETTSAVSSRIGETVASSVFHVGVTTDKTIKRLVENNAGNLEIAKRSKRDEEEDILGLTREPGDDILDTISSRNHSLSEQNSDQHATPHPGNNGNEFVSGKLESESDRPVEYEESTGLSFGRETSSDSEREEKKSGNRPFESEETATESEFHEIEEENYDYENFRAEYEQQLEDARSNNLTFNYTDNGEPEETPKDAIKKIVEFKMPKNCTKEELTQFGVKALECLAFDYQHSRNKSDARKVLNRTWMVFRVWLCIYLCIAVPCWFQKGWCCCCFRCSMCFPHDVILEAKHYYAQNPPGVLVDQPRSKKAEEPPPINYKPTLFELDAYEDFESAIRNL